MTRHERLTSMIENELSWADLSEWESAEGIPDNPLRYVMIDSCTCAWLQFGETIESLTFMSEGFEPVALYDLDTGDHYMPVLTWTKAP